MKVAFRTYSLAVRIAAAAAAIGVFLFLAGRVVVPNGYLSVTTDLVRPAPFVSAPKPSERLAEPVEADGTMVTPIIGDPVYLDLKPPSHFDTVAVRLRYVNGGQPLVELGALGSELDQQFDMRPAHSTLLDSLQWGRVASGKLSLYQRTHRYASVDEFLRDPPERSRVAVYRAEAPIPYLLPGYVPSPRERELDVSLRGSQRLLAYAKDEALHFTFVMQDMNREAGADPVVLSIYREGEEKPVHRAVLEDDGNTLGDQRSSKLRTLAATLPGAPEGVYKVELTATPDVFIRKIVTRQRKLVFVDRLHLGDHVGYSDSVPKRTVFMNGRRLTARIAHAEGLQTLTVAGRPMPIDEPLTKYVRQVPVGSGVVAVSAPLGDVLLETDGFFSLSRDEFFDPAPLTIEWYSTAADLEARDIDYVITSYEPPDNDGGLRVAEAVFDTASLARTKEGAYRFLISAPAIPEVQAEARLASVTFIMRREKTNWLDALSGFLSRFKKTPEAAPPVLSDGQSYGESPL